MMSQCALCNAALGEQYHLEIEGGESIDIALCDMCRDDLLAEPWIECTGVTETDVIET
ncbi:MAG: hypothetical protein ACI9TI_000884 [Natronomonas sp.]|jgi:hypothetical protein|uniref:hypothetical protein n=1 Tax=Natronomonas sp. TaxID=2184060 RepID=UPI00398A3C4F